MSRQFTITVSSEPRDFTIVEGGDTRSFTINNGVGPAGTAATVSVGTTTTGNAGTNASVTNSGTSSAAVLNFTIPRGDTGAAGPNTVTSATTTNFTTGQVLYANGTNVGSLSRSGIDTRTTFPNDDVTAATASPDPDTIVKRNGAGDIVAATAFLTNEGGGFSAGGVTGYSAHQVTLGYATTTASRTWTLPDANGTIILDSNFGTGVSTALAVNVGSAGAFVVNGGALGTPSSGTLTSCTGLPISTGVSGLGANVATFLATPTSANLAAAVTDETGTGSLVFATSPTITTPTIARSGNGTVTTFQDGSGKTVTVETASFGTQVSINATGGTLGAYATLNGQLESWVNVIAASNTTDLRWMRFGTLSNRFRIDRLNDTATIIRATPFSFANNAPTNSFYMETDGRVGYGTASPNARAIIDLTSTTQGFLPPRMTTAQRDAITGAPAGLEVYDTTTNRASIYNGSAWRYLLTNVLPAGGTAAGTAPLKFTTQASPLSTPEQGAMELIGNSLQFTQLAKRRGVVMSQAVSTSDLTVANTVTESTALITAAHGANYLEVGKCEEIVIRGVISQRNNAAAFGTFRVKYAGVTIQSIITPASTAMTNVNFELRIALTCRSVGVSGTARIDTIMLTGSSVAIDPGAGSLQTINTTTAQDTTVTFIWNEANAANTVTFTQARVLCIEPNR